ncbi:uncharacterized protein LOC123318928 [Coccinella septempunctata]|uniref:uncharacterized protein LOC123318928 n=1 Tax=Coccinella septempunctata TaxID=41139 RepID=UPI001D078C86|nr:uncharacterized protein LOC123318928 [Coccinella septempunctata]
MSIASVFEIFGRLWISLRHGRGYIVDTITGLSDDDKKLIRDSKEVLLQLSLESGGEIMIKFLKKYPQYLDFYPFKDVPIDELKSNKAFLELCTELMNAIETWIGKLDDPEELKHILEKTGEEYIREKNITDPQYFLDFGETFVDYLVPLVDKKTLKAWKKFMEFAMKTMASSLKC